jgi:broad specificity phosphatase PhoE
MGVHLILVRHGRTAWNREVRFRGRMDVPLDEVGQEQVRAVARAIQQRWPAAAALYTSPLARARETAAPIGAALGLPVQIHVGLRDVDYGAWTGLTPHEAAARHPEHYNLWLTAPSQVHFPAGETLGDVQARLQQFLDEIGAAYSGKRVILVGHVVVNRVLLCTLLGLTLDAFWRLGQENAAINLAHYQAGGSVVECLNDTCHLQGGSDV